jgi:hypothetical protein
MFLAAISLKSYYFSTILSILSLGFEVLGFGIWAPFNLMGLKPWLSPVIMGVF